MSFYDEMINFSSMFRMRWLGLLYKIQCSVSLIYSAGACHPVNHLTLQPAVNMQLLSLTHWVLLSFCDVLYSRGEEEENNNIHISLNNKPNFLFKLPSLAYINIIYPTTPRQTGASQGVWLPPPAGSGENGPEPEFVSDLRQDRTASRLSRWSSYNGQC